MLQPTSAFCLFARVLYFDATRVSFGLFFSLKGPLFLLRVHFLKYIYKYIYIYHLGHTKASSPIALTQGMNNISCCPPPPPHQEADFLSPFSHEVNWRSSIKAAVLSSKTWIPLFFRAWVRSPQTIYPSSSSLLRTTSPFSHFFPSPPQLHCYLSSRPRKTRHAVPPPASCNSFIHFCVQAFMCSCPPPPRSHQK